MSMIIIRFMEGMIKKRDREWHKKLLQKIQIIEKAKGRNFDVMICKNM